MKGTIFVVVWRLLSGRKNCSHLIGKKEYNELGKTVSLMLKMCRSIFGFGKAVVLESGF